MFNTSTFNITTKTLNTATKQFIFFFKISKKNCETFFLGLGLGFWVTIRVDVRVGLGLGLGIHDFEFYKKIGY